MRFTAAELGTQLGAIGTIVQVSTAFCAPCRAARTRLRRLVTDAPHLKYVDIDAESNLELVRKIGLESTPTVLVLDAHGTVIGRQSGEISVPHIIAALGQATSEDK